MSTPQKLTLSDVQRQFEGWRKTKQHRSPIPEELWDAAIKLVGKHSTLEVSKALNLTHSKLKKRIASSSSSPTTPSPDFVTLGVMQPTAAQPSCALELSDTNGAVMKMSITGVPCLDIMKLIQAFWNRNS